MNRKIEIEKKLKKIKPFLHENFFVDKIGYFGSFAKNKQNESSDIDILVSFRKPIGWAFFDLQNYLESNLKEHVDLVSINALRKELKDSILKDVIYL
jgi:predicted nucleotidyltransferase